MRCFLISLGTPNSRLCISRFSRPVRRSSTLGCWKTIPMDFLTFDDSFTTSKPFTHALPDVGFNMVQSIERRVVFPAPLGPRRPNISPSSILRFKPSTAVIFLYFLVRVSVMMTAVLPPVQGGSTVVLMTMTANYEQE